MTFARHPTARVPLQVALACGLLSLGLCAQAAPTADAADLSLEQLLAVTVTGAAKYEQRQSEAAAAVSVITRQEIKTYGWRTLDDALASLPGVYRTYDRQYAYLGTRGFNVLGDFNTRILLTINGNRVNDAVYDQAYIGRDFPLDLDLIERIEFIPGPGGAVYGQNAMFGVVNVVTRTGASLGGAQVSVAAQNPQRLREGRVSWGQRTESGLDVLLSLSALRAKGEDRFYDYGPAGVSGIASGLDGERDQEWLVRLAYGGWNLELVHGDRRKDDPTGYYRSDPLVAGSYQRDRMLLAQLNYEGKASVALLQAPLHYTARLFMGQERYTAPMAYGGDASLQTASSAWHGLELRGVYTGVAQHKLMLGLEGQINRQQDQAYDNLVATPNTLDINLLKNGTRLGVYAQDEWALREDLTATLGARVDSSTRARRSVTPRVGLVWQAGPSSTFKALFGKAFRPPNVYEHDYSDGVSLVANSSLKGETIQTLELAGEYRASSSLVWRASAYRWAMNGLVTLGVDPATGLASYLNGGDVSARGLELGVESNWAGGGRLRSSVSTQAAHRADGLTQTNAPRWMGRLNLSEPLPGPRSTAALELRHDGTRLTNEGRTLAAHTLLNLSLATALAPGWELWLGVQNATGARYQHPGSRNTWQDALEQDGRSLRARLTWQL